MYTKILEGPKLGPFCVLLSLTEYVHFTLKIIDFNICSYK